MTASFNDDLWQVSVITFITYMLEGVMRRKNSPREKNILNYSLPNCHCEVPKLIIVTILTRELSPVEIALHSTLVR